MTGCDYEDSLGDLLTALMHWSDVRNLDFGEALYLARHHYSAELIEAEGGGGSACQNLESNGSRLSSGPDVRLRSGITTSATILVRPQVPVRDGKCSCMDNRSTKAGDDPVRANELPAF
jgi:hypothetical protein